MEDKDIIDVVGEPIKQLPGGHHAHALGRHDCDVVALGQLYRFEQLLETLLLDKQDVAITVLWSRGRV